VKVTQDVSHVFKNTGFKVFANALAAGGVVRALCYKGGAAMSRTEIDKLTDWVKTFGAKGLAWVKVTEAGAESSIAKFMSADELAALPKAVDAQAGDIILFGADKPEAVSAYLGPLRVELAKRAGLNKKPGVFNFSWVVDFPMFEYSPEDKKMNAVHHPFTRPRAEDEKSILEGASADVEAMKKMKARAYDLVLNGNELGGGSIRIHRMDLQQKVFDILGISKESAQAKFGFLLDALDFGAPPHGGIALGLDRFVALMAGEDSIRDVMAYPKTQKGTDPLSGAPSPVDDVQLRDLHIKSIAPTPK
jgi:aspartyl-tRNA synthetase